MRHRSRLQHWIRRALLAQAARRGIDLTRLDAVPPSLVWPLGREGLEPPARLAEIRAEQPVHRLTSFLGLGVWLVTGFEEAREVLADQTSYSTDIRPYVGRSGAADGDIGGLGFTDPPDHTRLRRLLTPEFTMRRLSRLTPLIAEIVEQQLDRLEEATDADGVVDLVPTFGFAVPFLVICELLGLPDEERETFRRLGAARFDVSRGGYGSLGAISGSRAFLLEEAKRQRLDPGPGLIGQIIREHGHEVSDFDLGGLADGVFTGGMETSAGMLALGTAVLVDHPQWWQRLAGDPDAVEPVVEELLRHLSVVQVAFPRFVRGDVAGGEVVVAGQRIPAGDVVLVSLPAADRDPALGERIEEFDPARPVRSHLAFGHGLHRCVGAELARMELRAAYPALARRFPGMTLADDRLDLPVQSLVFGIESLPVRPFGAATPFGSAGDLDVEGTA
ncbi:cytochrome P450 [Nocardioides pacificus]